MQDIILMPEFKRCFRLQGHLKGRSDQFNHESEFPKKEWH